MVTTAEHDQRVEELKRLRQGLHETSVKEERDFTEDENALYDRWTRELRDMGGGAGRKTRGNTSMPLSSDRQTTGQRYDLETDDSGMPQELRGDGGFGDVGEMLSAIFKQRTGAGADSRLAKLETRNFAIGESGGSTGGFFIPTEHIPDILDNDTIQPAQMLDKCARVPMSREALSMPAWSDTSHATSPYGIEWAHIAEAGDFPERNMAAAALHLTAVKHGCLVYISNEWLADSDRVSRTRTVEALGASLRWYIESLIVRGTGVAQPLGLVNADASLTIDAEVGQAASTLIYENVVNMHSRLLPGSHDRAIWLVSQSALPSLLSMTLVSGAGGSSIPLVMPSNSGAVGAPANQMLGLPLYISEHCSAVGTAGDLILVDPARYCLGLRRLVSIDIDPSYRFKNDQTAFRAQARFAGAPMMSSTFQPANSAPTCGFCVMTETRS